MDSIEFTGRKCLRRPFSPIALISSRNENCGIHCPLIAELIVPIGGDEGGRGGCCIITFDDDADDEGQFGDDIDDVDDPIVL